MSNAQDDSLIIRTWHEIAVNALESRASDIHIEAASQATLVRIRVDGLLQVQAQFEIQLHERLITRIKILARLDIAEKRLPQDGRLLIGPNFSKPNVDCRVQSFPLCMEKKQLFGFCLIASMILPSNKLGYFQNSWQYLGMLSIKPMV